MECRLRVMNETAAIETCELIDQHHFAGTLLFEMVLAAPRCAQMVQPGQFVHLALPEQSQHILRRPLSVYQANAKTGTITLLYQTVGQGTQLLSELPAGTQLSLLGPLGRGWQSQEAEKCLLIAGGVGAAPLYLLAQELCSNDAQVDLIIGAATANLLVCEASFSSLLGSQHIHITTDDGSRGFKGFTTELAAKILSERTYDYLAACGPEPMLKSIANIALGSKLRLELSLERRMACGVGACLSCVVDTTTGKKRSCLDGPVFDAEEVCW